MNERKNVILLHSGTIESIQVWSSKKKMCEHYPEFKYSYVIRLDLTEEKKYKGYTLKKVKFN